MAVASFGWEGIKLMINADNANTKVTLTESAGNITIKDVNVNRAWTISRSAVGSIQFNGGNGADTFINFVATLPVFEFGNGGNDYLEGFNGADYLVGGSRSAIVGMISIVASLSCSSRMAGTRLLRLSRVWGLNGILTTSFRFARWV